VTIEAATCQVDGIDARAKQSQAAQRDDTLDDTLDGAFRGD
jgi:hypothetical protein